MTQANPSVGGSEVGPKPRKRSVVERTVAAILIVVIVAGFALELSARRGYRQTLAAMQQRMSASEPMQPAEADQFILGWTRKSIEKSEAGEAIEYQWRSLFEDLRIRLLIDADGKVVSMDRGRAPAADPVARSPERSPARLVQNFHGLSAGSPPGFALDLTRYNPRELEGEQGHLTRELIRQAVLITARDELGLPTRDKALNEPLPDEADPSLAVLSLVTWQIKDRHVSVYLVAHGRQGEPPPIHLEFDVPPGGWLEELATRTESLTTTEFVAALRTSGYSGQARAFLPEGAVAAAIGKDLANFDLLSQYAAVRALHEEIGNSGESPERLAALSRGYAHLGALTDYLWSPASKVFRARGLVYAERLLRKWPNRQQALRNRAYVRAFTGLHSSALADLAAAAAIPESAAVPVWAGPIEAFCRSDARRLAAMLSKGETASLTSYLNLLLASASQDPRTVEEAARRMREATPDCLHAHEALMLIGPSVDAQRQAAFAASTDFTASLRSRLAARRYIPESALQLLSKQPEDFPGEMRARGALIKTLREAGGLGRDTGEPSLATLATLIQEMTFVHSWRRLQVELMSLGSDPAEAIAAIKPLIEGHPFEALIDVYVLDQVAAARAMGRILRVVEELPVEPSVGETMRVYLRYKPRGIGDENLEKTCDKFARQSDAIFPDLVRILRMKTSAKVKAEASRVLREVSPLSPAGVAAAVAFDWERISTSADEWERQFRYNSDVIAALAERYAALDRDDDAERCLKRRIELLPEQGAYHALARLYWKRGDDKRWEETLTTSFTVPSFGAEFMEGRVALARHYLRRKEWDLARPHVDVAARSYPWPEVQCAADFCELTGDGRRAEAFYRAASEQDEYYADEWYKWCRRTGGGNLDAARSRMQVALRFSQTFPNAESRSKAAMLFILESRPEESLKKLEEALTFETWPYYYLLAALRADELGRSDRRDDFLKQAVNVTDRRFAEFRHWLRRFLAAPEAPLDRNLLDWTIRTDWRADGDATIKSYLAGSFLAAHGRHADAIDYLRQAAAVLGIQRDEPVMAAHALRLSGAEVGELREGEFDVLLDPNFKLLRQARAAADHSNWEFSIAKCTELIAQAPDFPDGYQQRSFGSLQMEHFESALADMNHACALLPGCARFLCERGIIQERLGQYEAAIADYEAALTNNPDYGRAHHELAFLRGACPDPKFRDAGEAQVHAQGSYDSGESPRYVALAALALAAAEGGEFSKAVAFQSRAVQQAPEKLRAAYLERQQLFARGKPYHRQPNWWRQ